MPKAKKSETVPKAMQETFDRIATITDRFSQEHLNDEYAQIIRYAIAALCRKKPSPLTSGKDTTWACGIIHAIGMVNFLFDKSQTPHMSAQDIYKHFGISASTGQAKSKTVRDLLKMHQMDPDWCLPSLMDHNPLAWMISFNGYILDARSLPRAVQEIALAKGLIPYLPDESAEIQMLGSKTSPPKTQAKTSSSPNALFIFDVWIIDGPMQEKFLKKNPEISRTIEIKGSDTLADFHKIIFKAFNREEEHMYEFQIGGQYPDDPDAKRYSLGKAGLEGLAGDVSETAIAALGLSVGEMFGYWFDFGDDWWHQIEVLDIVEHPPDQQYPVISKRVGASPPQYADFD